MDLKYFSFIFAAVFIAELGDKTQLATMLFASDKEVSRWLVFFCGIRSAYCNIGNWGFSWFGYFWFCKRKDVVYCCWRWFYYCWSLDNLQRLRRITKGGIRFYGSLYMGRMKLTNRTNVLDHDW